MIEIQPRAIIYNKAKVPGSKSHTHRTELMAALSDGECHIKGALKSEDTLLTAAALRDMGISVTDRNETFVIMGKGGDLSPCGSPIYLGNSGTSMRLLTGFCALGKGSYTLTGTKRMQERPVGDLLEGLKSAGVKAISIEGNGCPPVQIMGGSLYGGKTEIDCGISSQFLSSLLIVSPFAKETMDIWVTKGPVSKPYIDLTVDVMDQFGVKVERDGYNRFRVPAGQRYRSGEYAVEPDASNAGYFWGAAAITGGTVVVDGVFPDSRQGDVKLAGIFEQMGCKVTTEKFGIAVKGGELKAVDVDMAAMPDMVPTLAVCAAYAKGKTVIRNIHHLRAKESDRIQAVINELTKMGIEADYIDEVLVIQGGCPHGAEIDTYDDHRIAMSFAMAGLATPGIYIKDENCVAKSFPNYWDVFETLGR